MSIFNTINSLRTNIFGGGGSGETTAIARQSTIELADKSPTSRLNKDPMSFSSLSYPKDLINDVTNGHYMLFYVNVQNKTKFPYTKASNGVQYGGTTSKQVYKDKETGVPGSGKTISVPTNQETHSGGGAIQGENYYTESGVLENEQTKKYGDVSTLRKNKTKMRTGLASSWNPTTRITDSVAIYLPPNVQDNYTTTYNATSTGMIGFLAASAGAATRAYQNDDFDQVARTVLGTAGGLLEEVAKNMGLSAIEMLTQSEGGYELLNKTFGRATNPYMEVLFSGPELRTFTYNFTFAPRNAPEQEEVRKIIHLFRFYQAPELREGQSMFMGLPAEFDIHYMYQHEDGKTSSENDYYNKIATCVLQSVNVDYTPGEVRSHANGAPVTIKMSLSFLETEMITKDHIEAGY